jgi:hypothetical protein
MRTGRIASSNGFRPSLSTCTSGLFRPPWKIHILSKYLKTANHHHQALSANVQYVRTMMRTSNYRVTVHTRVPGGVLTTKNMNLAARTRRMSHPMPRPRCGPSPTGPSLGASSSGTCDLERLAILSSNDIT